MRKKKKTAPQTRQRRKASSPKQPGLIARGKNARDSARPESALDNRSHRTDMRFTCAATSTPEHGRGPAAEHCPRTI